MTWIPDIKNWPRLWSVWLSGVGGALITFASVAPAHLASVWASMPASFQDAVPDGVVKWIGIAMVFLSPIARAIRQEKLHRGDK